jgi:hypothetical protein
MNMETVTDLDEALSIFRSVGATRKGYVTFWYVTRSGELVRIAGNVIGWANSENLGRCVRVRVADGTVTRYAASGIRDGKAQKAAQRPQPAVRGPVLATDAQVRYALSFCGLTCPGGGNYYQPAEADFRQMSRHQISAWIDMARDELGAWA